ncbi:MAG: UvrD-helicase domain-containing protein [Spirochaetia bacterium]|jgi:DNA helicase-2/ATP-dependent DNA helicase PcrA|nr:UvrD-helicase domain-containing protein [Spirochaetia bacterium]
MNITDSLNNNQREAVLHTDGPLLILAGAGSGKTRVITHRIANIISERKAAPYSIFAVTFTNKAAEEMRTRVIDLVGPAGNSVFVKTFHSAAVYILRRFGEAVRVPRNFSIYDTSDQASVIKQILEEMNLNIKSIKPASIAARISEIKDKAAFFDGTPIDELLPDTYIFNFRELYDKYHARMTAQNALDFNDLLIKTVQLLRTSPESLAALQRQWKYFMVDEYQDTNHAQYIMIKALASATKNICVVGDDDQSIYSWRGADIRNILDFEKDYKDTKVVTLEENYRSREPIIKAASSLIANNIDRKEKNVIAVNGDGERIIHCQANNEYGEAEFVVRRIVSLKLVENLSNKDFAIFYRTNSQSRIFEEQFRKENIPYRIIGGMKFYDRKEIKDIIAYLKLIMNPDDDVSLMRIINVPSRGIGTVTLKKISDIANEKMTTLWNAVNVDTSVKGVADFKTLMNSLMSMAAEVPAEKKLHQFIMHTIELSAYRRYLEEEKSREGQGRIDNLDEFINSVYDYEMKNPEASLADFLQDISLQTSEETPVVEGEDPAERADYITLMTVHNAKGLEFPVVFLTGMEEDMFPHKLSIDTEEGIEEERRLCYVGITRAKERLFITNAELRRSFMGLEYKEPSRFIDEMQTLMENLTFGSDDIRFGKGKPFAATDNFRYAKKKDEPVELSENSPFLPSEKAERGSAFKLRDRVIHPKYGTGTIMNIEGSGDTIKLIILFGASKKSFLEKYTPLEKTK